MAIALVTTKKFIRWIAHRGIDITNASKWRRGLCPQRLVYPMLQQAQFKNMTVQLEATGKYAVDDAGGHHRPVVHEREPPQVLAVAALHDERFDAAEQ